MQNNNYSKKIEIVLFYINDTADKKLESILGIFKVVSQQISPKEMLEICVKSIKKNMPDASITLFTDTKTYIHDDIDDLKIQRFEDIRHDHLMFDLQRIRRDYLLHNVNTSKSFIFTDIDVIFNKDLSSVFNFEFDIASPAKFHQNLKYSDRFVPINSLMSIINGGLWFVRPNKQTISFYNEWLDQMIYLSEYDLLDEYGPYKEMVKRDFLKWWGEPHSLMVMFGDFFKKNEKTLINYKNTKFRLIEEDIYNFAPDMVETTNQNFKLKMKESDFSEKYLFHFRGGRKIFMRQIANKLNLI